MHARLLEEGEEFFRGFSRKTDGANGSFHRLLPEFELARINAKCTFLRLFHVGAFQRALAILGKQRSTGNGGHFLRRQQPFLLLALPFEGFSLADVWGVYPPAHELGTN